jgi:hypothetical protein
MRIIYTHHAQQRMTQRSIDPQQVAETLDSPDNVMSGDRREQIAIKNYGNREVQVVFEEIEPDTMLVYTVMKPKVRPNE